MKQVKIPYTQTDISQDAPKGLGQLALLSNIFLIYDVLNILPLESVLARNSEF